MVKLLLWKKSDKILDKELKLSKHQFKLKEKKKEMAKQAQ